MASNAVLAKDDISANNADLVLPWETGVTDGAEPVAAGPSQPDSDLVLPWEQAGQQTATTQAPDSDLILPLETATTATTQPTAQPTSLTTKPAPRPDPTPVSPPKSASARYVLGRAAAEMVMPPLAAYNILKPLVTDPDLAKTLALAFANNFETMARKGAVSVPEIGPKPLRVATKVFNAVGLPSVLNAPQNLINNVLKLAGVKNESLTGAQLTKLSKHISDRIGDLARQGKMSEANALTANEAVATIIGNVAANLVPLFPADKARKGAQAAAKVATTAAGMSDDAARAARAAEQGLATVEARKGAQAAAKVATTAAGMSDDAARAARAAEQGLATVEARPSTLPVAPAIKPQPEAVAAPVKPVEAQAALPKADETQAALSKMIGLEESPTTPQRGYAKQVLESPLISPEVKADIQARGTATYVPVTHVKTGADADIIIQLNGPDHTRQLVMDTGVQMPERVRTTLSRRLVKHSNDLMEAALKTGNQQDADRFARQAGEMADFAAKRGTELGQGIDAFKDWDGILTPEGALRIATQRVLKARAKPAVSPEGVVSLPKDVKTALAPAEVQKITELAKKVQAAPDGFQKNEAIVDTLSYIDQLTGKPTRGDVLWSMWYANILSGYQTHQRNLIDTAVNVLHDTAAYAISHRENPLLALRQLLSGAQSGAIEAARTLTTGRGAVSGAIKMEGQRGLEAVASSKLAPYFRGGLKNPLNYWKFIGRALQGEDALFFKPAQEASAWVLARKLAKSEGLQGKALTRRVEEVLGRTTEQQQAIAKQASSEGLTGLNLKKRIKELTEQIRPSDILENSRARAGRTTYNYEPEGVLGAVSRAIASVTRQVPALRIVAPFTRIVANVTNRSLDYTPLGFKRAFFGHAGQKALHTSPERIEHVAKAALGTIAMGTLYAGDALGYTEITGAGPGDPKKRNQLRESGWRPYSVKIGGRYIDYRLTPYAIPFAIVGGLRDLDRYYKEEDVSWPERLQLATVLGGKAIIDQSFLRGVADTFKIFGGETETGMPSAFRNMLARSASGLVPMKGLLSQIDRVLDPTLTSNATIQEALLREVPFARRAGKPMVNLLGESAKSDTALIVGAKGTDPVWGLLARKGVYISAPSTNTQLKDGPFMRTMEPDEYYDYLVMSGKILRNRISYAMPRLERMTREQVQAWLDEQTDASKADSARGIAKARLTRLAPITKHEPLSAEAMKEQLISNHNK